MASVNKALIVGHLGKDPEFKYTPGGQPVATFSIATTEKYTDKGGQKQEKTEWHNIVVWGKSAEHANQYLKKGSLVYIEGKITTRSWDGNDGQKHYRTEIVVSHMQFLSGRPDGAAPAQNRAPQQQQAESSWGAPENQPPASSWGSTPIAPEDDLPF